MADPQVFEFPTYRDGRFGPLRWCRAEGFFWLRCAGYPLFSIKHTRRARLVLFSDRYVNWRVGPYSVRVGAWPKMRRR